MNAKEARIRTNKVKQRLADNTQRREAAAYDAKQRRVKAVLTEKLPSWIAHSTKLIQDAISDGRNYASMEYNGKDEADEALIHAVAKQLRGDGYNVEYHFSDGDGMWFDRYTLEISW